MGTIVSFTYGFGLYGSTYLIPVFLQNALGYSATAAGSALIPGGLALAMTTPIAGRMADHYPPRTVAIIGLLLFSVSFFIFAELGGRITYLELLMATIVGRIGLGLILPALNLATLRHLEPHHLAQSSVVVSYMRQLGGVLGIAAIAVFVEWRESLYQAKPLGVFSAYSQGFFLLGMIVLSAIVAACLMKHSTATSK
jgi:predicted MFS family arabinose efflux permease